MGRKVTQTIICHPFALGDNFVLRPFCVRFVVEKASEGHVLSSDYSGFPCYFWTSVPYPFIHLSPAPVMIKYPCARLQYRRDGGEVGKNYRGPMVRKGHRVRLYEKVFCNRHEGPERG
jgi:hypothetical protein